MDAFSLKKDNRKKFQDKQKLKRRHATPSDRKYHKLNAQEQANNQKETTEQGEENEEQQQQLKSNEDRYVKDIVYERVDPEWEQLSQQTNQILKNKILREQQQQIENVDKENNNALNNLQSQKNRKKKDYLVMDVNELNNVIGNKMASTKDITQNVNKVNKVSEPTILLSHVSPVENGEISKLPNDLHEDQDLLDDFL